MTADNVIGLVLAIGLAGYLVAGPPVPGEVLMSSASWLQFVALIVVVVGTAIPLGRYMAKVYGDDETAPGDRFFGPVERLIYRMCRVDPESEQRWTVYAYSLLAFSIFSFLFVYAIQRLQGVAAAQPDRRARRSCPTCRSTPRSAS